MPENSNCSNHILTLVDAVGRQNTIGLQCSCGWYMKLSQDTTLTAANNEAQMHLVQKGCWERPRETAVKIVNEIIAKRSGDSLLSLDLGRVEPVHVLSPWGVAETKSALADLLVRAITASPSYYPVPDPDKPAELRESASGKADEYAAKMSGTFAAATPAMHLKLGDPVRWGRSNRAYSEGLFICGDDRNIAVRTPAGSLTIVARETIVMQD